MMLEIGGGDKPKVIPGPTEDELRKKALERERKIQKSRRRFLQRQQTSGVVQLQAPTLGGL